MLCSDAQSLCYRYVLGELTKEERRQVEERLITDDYRERLRAAECELLAAYVSGYLGLDMRERLERHFFASAENTEKLDLARLLYDEARANMATCPNLNALVYRYFLGQVSPEEKGETEAKLARDANYGKEVKAARHALIVAYTLEEATGEKRKTIQPYFLGSKERLGELRFAETIYECLEYIKQPQTQGGARSRSFDRLRRWLIKPVGVVSIIGLVALIWALFFYQSPITKGLNIPHAARSRNR